VIRDAALALPIIAGLLGPAYRGAGLMSLIKSTSFALAFEKRCFRNASLMHLMFRLPNTDFTCLLWFKRDANLNFASYLCWTNSCSNLWLTRAPPLSPLSIPVTSYGLKGTPGNPALRKRMNMLNIRNVNHAGLVGDVGAGVTHDAINHDILFTSHV